MNVATIPALSIMPVYCRKGSFVAALILDDTDVCGTQCAAIDWLCPVAAVEKYYMTKPPLAPII